MRSRHAALHLATIVMGVATTGAAVANLCGLVPFVEQSAAIALPSIAFGVLLLAAAVTALVDRLPTSIRPRAHEGQEVKR